MYVKMQIVAKLCEYSGGFYTASPEQETADSGIMETGIPVMEAVFPVYSTGIL